jgi:hypothetical protein
MPTKPTLFFYAFVAFFTTQSCQAQRPPAPFLKLDDKHVVLFLDSTQAAKAITTDGTDNYFGRVTMSEISIQMRRELGDEPREKLVAQYTDFLKRDVENFTGQDTEFIERIMEKVFKSSNECSSNIFPDTLRLIKTKGTHYGEGVWYTREKCIVIPKDELERRKNNPFGTTMAHEVFHVYSRIHPAKRSELYRLIGFESIGLDKLELPPMLARRILYNPDGVDFAQKISLRNEDGSHTEAVPIIYSKSVGYQPGQDVFFSYVEFNLFEIKKLDNGNWSVQTQEDGYSPTLAMDKMTDFFRQIRDNTGYIIHPDEIMADNFSFILNPNLSIKFSKDGKELLKSIEEVLKR